MMNSSELRTVDRGRLGFTLVELLVVITIIALISAVALPVVLPALNERRVSEAAREFQAGLVGIRDAAIRANAPRGIRLLPDPVLSPAPYGNGAPGVLASNRFVTIEPAPDYSEGLIGSMALIPASPSTVQGQFLKVTQSLSSTIGGVPVPNDPTGWYFNIRQGDKIRFNDSGAYYTIAGPMFTGPGYTPADSNKASFLNSERYVNFTNPDPSHYAPWFAPNSEFLNLVNGVDDDNDGWIDESFDGIDNDGDGVVDPGYNGVDDNNNNFIDEPLELMFNNGGEYETEVILGTNPTLANSTPYTILRRAIVSPGSREVTLPDGIVIDMTTWYASSITQTVNGPNGLNVVGQIQFPERSRVPVDPYTYFVDIMIAPSGQVVQAGSGSAGINSNGLTPTSNMPFYHFWLTEREGVVAPLWTPPISTTPFIPGLNPNHGNAVNSLGYASSQNYLLPMPKGTQGYPDKNGPNPPYDPMPQPYTTAPVYLTGERRLVTIFCRTGQVVTNSIEVFNVNDINVPFYDAQAGIKEQQ